MGWSWGNFVRGFCSLRGAKRALYLYSGMVVVGNHFGGVVFCKGVSMSPTMVDGDVVVVDRMSVLRNCLHRNDIVCAMSPTDSRVTICKRLVYKELDEVEKDGELERIPLGYCYLLGDHVEESTDSRDFGPVPLGLIQDRVVLRIWPPNRFGWLSTHPFYVPEERK